MLANVTVVLGDADGPLQAVSEGLVTCRGVTDIASADFDGDSNLNLIISCYSSSYGTSKVYLRKGRGDGTFQQGVDFVNVCVIGCWASQQV